MSRDGASRWMVGAAGVVLLGTSGMHALGYPPLSAQLAGSGIQPVWLAAVKGLWLVFSLHLVILGALLLAAASRPERASRGILAIAGLIPVGDTAMLLAFVGIFPGSLALGLAALLLYAGAALRPSRRLTKGEAAAGPSPGARP